MPPRLLPLWLLIKTWLKWGRYHSGTRGHGWGLDDVAPRVVADGNVIQRSRLQRVRDACFCQPYAS